MMHLRKTIIKVKEEIFEKSTKKKKIDAKTKLKTARTTVKLNAFSLNNIFFSRIAANADNNAEKIEK